MCTPKPVNENYESITLAQAKLTNHEQDSTLRPK
jgi:hypothetical protein